MKKVAFLLGLGTYELSLPDETTVLEPRPAPALADPLSAVREALAAPIGCPPLAELARGRKSACVVISDLTRPVPNREILPPILETLAQAGLGPERVLILIATGTHRPNLGPEIVELVGEEIAGRYRVVNHDAQDPEANRQVDVIEGVPVTVNRRYLDSELKILTGLIEPHPYAGYSGGRKSIVPGLSGFQTMQYMHSYEMIAHPKVDNCVLAENPFHQAGLRVSRLVGVDFLVNVTIDKHKKATGVFAGELDAAHLAGCRAVEEHAVVELEEPGDLVITSAGGAPLDLTFYQSGKGLTGARSSATKGATVLTLCDGGQGMGNREFCEIVGGCEGPEGFRQKHSDPANFVLDQWAVQSFYAATADYRRILVYSPHLSQEDLAPFGIKKVDDPQAEVDRLLPHCPRVVAIPQGPYVMGRVRV